MQPTRSLTCAFVLRYGRRPALLLRVELEAADAAAAVLEVDLTLDRALDASQHSGTRLCCLCGAAAELDPVLKGFDRGFGSED